MKNFCREGMKSRRKRKAICLLLTMALVAAGIPAFTVSAFAAESPVLTISAFAGEKGSLPVSGGVLSDGTYCLEGDLKLTGPLSVGENASVDLYLNGYTLTGAEDASVITVLSGGTLNLYDSFGAGPNAATETADSEDRGTITGGSGTVTDEEFSFGGGLFISETATVNIYGGRITGNTAEYGGAIYNQGKLCIYSLLADENLTCQSGTIFNKGTLVIDGTVSIVNNTSEEGAGAVLNQGSLTLGGSVSITDNHAGGYAGGIISLSGEENLVFTGGTYKIEDNTILGDTPADVMYSFWGTELPFTVSGEIKEESRIGLFSASDDTEETVRVTEGTGKQDLSSYFFSDDENYKVFTDENGALSVKPAVELVLMAEEPLVSSGVTFDRLLTKRILKHYLDEEEYVYSLPEGNYFLSEDIVFEEYMEGYEIRINGNTNLFLNGKTLQKIQGSGQDLFLIGEGASLTLYGDGNLKGYDRIANIDGGSFTMNGGTVSENKCFGYGIIHVKAGSFTMNGGTIENNTYYNWSSAVWIEEDGTFNMLGGKITDNYSDQDPCGVTLYGKMVLGGNAVITGNTYRSQTMIEEVEKESNLVLHEGAQIEISEEKPLKTGAKIGVTIDDGNWDTEHDGGVIAENATSMKRYFVSDDEACKLEEKNENGKKQLVLTPYQQIELNLETQYVKIGDKAVFRILAEPDNLSGYTVSYADRGKEELTFTKTLPDNTESGAYFVKIERPGDGTYAAVKEYAFLYIGEECTVVFDTESADGGTKPGQMTGIEGQYAVLPEGGDLVKNGYILAGWEYDGEFFSTEEWFEYTEPVMTVYPFWEIAILEEPTKANGYTVNTELGDALSYQWQIRKTVMRNLTEEDFYPEDFAVNEDYTEFVNESTYFNLDFRYHVLSEGDSFCFDSDADLLCYSDTCGTLTRDGNHYTYTFADNWGAVRLENEEEWEGFTLSDCRLNVASFIDLEGETGKSLRNVQNGETYRCILTDSEGRTKETEEFRAVTFADVLETDWFRKAVYFATERGLVNPVTATLFGPDDPVSGEDVREVLSKLDGYDVSELFDEELLAKSALTREEAVRMLYTYEQYANGGFEGDWMFLLPYNDLETIGEDAYEAIAFMTMKGVVSGYETGAFRPERILTRAEFAKMLLEYSTAQ